MTAESPKLDSEIIPASEMVIHMLSLQKDPVRTLIDDLVQLAHDNDPDVRQDSLSTNIYNQLISLMKDLLDEDDGYLDEIQAKYPDMNTGIIENLFKNTVPLARNHNGSPLLQQFSMEYVAQCASEGLDALSEDIDIEFEAFEDSRHETATQVETCLTQVPTSKPKKIRKKRENGTKPDTSEPDPNQLTLNSILERVNERIINFKKELQIADSVIKGLKSTLKSIDQSALNGRTYVLLSIMTIGGSHAEEKRSYSIEEARAKCNEILYDAINKRTELRRKFATYLQASKLLKDPENVEIINTTYTELLSQMEEMR